MEENRNPAEELRENLSQVKDKAEKAVEKKAKELIQKTIEERVSQSPEASRLIMEDT